MVQRSSKKFNVVFVRTLVLAIVAIPLGLILDAIFPLEIYRPHYRGSITLSIVGEGNEQYITDGPGDGTGLAFLVSRTVHDDESPIFPTIKIKQRSLHIAIVSPIDKSFRAEQADPWRPMLSEYFKKNGYDEKYVQDVLKPDIYQESTLWLGIWANGLVIGIILYVAGRVCFGIAEAHRTRLKYKYGHCQSCGYDLTHADHKVCPECGA